MAHVATFEDFLLSQKKRESNKFNAPDRLKDWLKSIENLYVEINKWLSPFYDKNLITPHIRDIDVFEEFIGNYQIHKLELYIGNQILSFKPIGTLIMGSYGRVDIIGPKKDIRLIQKDWGKWFFSIGNTKKTYIPISSKLLETAIQDAINGTDILGRK